MTESSRLAFALLLWWLAFVAFFVAFHPGGILIPGAGTKNNPTVNVNGADMHQAQNPADVVKYMMLHLAAPTGATTGGSASTAGGTTNA